MEQDLNTYKTGDMVIIKRTYVNFPERMIGIYIEDDYEFFKTSNRKVYFHKVLCSDLVFRSFLDEDLTNV